MTRVLILATSRKTHGGITSVIKAYEKGYQWKKYNCHWVETNCDGAKWRKICYLLMGWFDFLLRIPFYDIVHVHFSAGSSAKRKRPFVMLAKLLKKKVIVHLHFGIKVEDYWNSDYDYLFSHANVSLLLSEDLKKLISNHIGNTADLRICYNPCPVVSMEPFYKKEKIVLFSGMLTRNKGYQDLIRAFGKVAPKCDGWKLVMAGDREIEEGRKIAKECNIEDRVVFLGWVKGQMKDEYFRKASFLCLASYLEGFPMAVLDAWAYGLPIVSTPVGGIPDVANNGVNMLLFPPGDIEVLAICLEQMMNNEELRKNIAKESVKLASTTFNIKTITKQLGDLYEELSNKE